ncbi:MAG: energy-coupling factor transporter ATPase [Selenomonadaceae bacterium]|nr:energy-coupling factor transporter ATPase [Selenomonadaceae bacterium]
MLRVEGVSYKYISESRHNAALTNVIFDVDEGEFVAIIGTNGSGKSTLAKHLNALLLPTTGKVYVDDMDTSVEANLWHIRSTVGMVFQNPDNQIIAALVEDDIAFGPENLGIAPDEIQRRVDLSLNAVNMLDYKNFAPHKLSGGQKQRIAIAGALALQTKCIVLDEPTAMLDPQGRAEVLATVKRLHDKQGLTIVYITHFMDEAALADRVFIMDKGQIVKTGTPKKVFTCVDEIKNLGLDVPIAVEMTYRLRKKGFNLPTNILSADDFASAVINN